MGGQAQRTAIVTGASKRVGRGVAAHLVQRGWSVISHVHEPTDEIEPGTTKVAADLAEGNVAKAFDEALDRLPSLRLLVNCASRFAWDGPSEFDADEFDSHMRINLRAPILLAEMLVERHSGGDALIANILDSKVVAPNPDYLSYTLSKQGLSAWTELAARSYASAGVRVNAIAPALMLRSPGQSEANFEAQHRNNPFGRGVTPGDVVAALDYLIDAAVVTGQTLVLDSGHRFMALDRDVQFLEDE